MLKLKQTYFTVIQNFLIRFSSSLIFFVIIPISARRLKSTEFEMLSYIISLGVVVNVFFDFGASLLGIKKLSLSTQKKLIKQIISTNFCHRIICSIIVVFLVNLLLLYNFPVYYSLNTSVYTLMFVIGFGLNSVWISQSLKKLKKQVWVDVLIKLTFPTLLIYFFAYNLLSVLLLLGGAYLASSLIIWMPYLSFKNIQMVKFYTEYFPFFYSKILISIYTSILPLVAFYILSTNNYNFFIVSEKLYRGMFSIYGPISQSLYPLFIILGAKDNNKFKSYLISQLKIQLAFVIAVVGVVLTNASFILGKYSGDVLNNYSSTAFKYMVGSYPFMVVGNVLGVQFLLSKGFVKEMNKSLLVGSVLMTVLLFLQYLQLLTFNLGINIFLCELVVCVSIIIYSVKKWK